MSDVQPSAPVDTASIAAHALESLEQAQQPSEPTPEPTPAPTQGDPTPTSQTPTLTEPEKPSEAELLLREEGYKTIRKPDGREPWIPRSKVLKMIESGLRKRAAVLDKEREGWTSERTTLSRAAEEARQFRQLMDRDPRALLQRMAELDSRYKAFIEQQQAPAQQVPKAEDDPEPGPDIDLGNGRSTYSLAGIRKLREWDRRQLERSFEQRLKPFSERVKQEEARQYAERANQALLERSQAQMQRARSWPKWAEAEDEILKVLQEDSRQAEASGSMPQLSIHDAYMQVVGPRLSSDHNKVREAVMKELNGAPKSTSVSTTGPEPVRKPGPMSTEDIARRALAKLEGRG